MGLRNGRNDLAAVGLGSLALKDDSAVEMLTALSGQIDALLSCNGGSTPASTAAAASMLESWPICPPMISLLEQPTTKNIPCFKVRSFEQFFRGLPCLRGKLRVIHG